MMRSSVIHTRTHGVATTKEKSRVRDQALQDGGLGIEQRITDVELDNLAIFTKNTIVSSYTLLTLNTVYIVHYYSNSRVM